MTPLPFKTIIVEEVKTNSVNIKYTSQFVPFFTKTRPFNFLLDFIVIGTFCNVIHAVFGELDININ